jgi:LCP family protein required for cell wall assembly
MSLPRDLKVTIPGYPDDKINAAYVFGDLDKYPGGGVGLLRRTITRNFGINIHYYAQVDFRGFEKLVDAFGGVNVDVPYPLKDDEYPTETNGYSGIYFAAGLQHLDGKQALRYARTRHPDNDIARSKRQQEVILSLRQQAANRDLRDLIGKFWPLLDILGTSVRTDLSRDQIIALARLGQGIPRENINTYSIQDLVSDYTDPETGTDYLLADWTKVRKRAREMVPNATLASPTPNPAATIAVRNGSQIDQFASRTVDRLKQAGFSGAVVDATPVPGVTAHSAIYDYTGGGETAFAVARALGLPESAVQDGPGAAPNGVGIVVVLGQDAPDTSPRPTVTPTKRSN